MLSPFQLNLFENFFSNQEKVAPRTHSHPSAQVKYTTNLFVFDTKLKKSWQVSWKRNQSDENPVLKLPAVFQFAPQSILDQLNLWADLAKVKKTSHSRQQLRQIELQLSTYLERPYLCPTKQYLLPQWEVYLHKKSVQKKASLQKYRSQGVYQNLRPVFDWLNTSFFKDQLHVELTWSKEKSGTSFHTIKTDREGNSYHLISISRGYDHPEVTREILGGILYHECLHIIIPPTLKNGRRVVHPPLFKKEERKYPYYQEWQSWHLYRLPQELGRYRFKRVRRLKSIRKLGQSLGHKLRLF